MPSIEPWGSLLFRGWIIVIATIGGEELEGRSIKDAMAAGPDNAGAGETPGLPHWAQP